MMLRGLSLRVHVCLACLHLVLRSARGLPAESWFEQPIDHFSTSSPTFRQRYLVQEYTSNVRTLTLPRNTTAVRSSPLLFFCGNEGDVETFGRFSGLLASLGEQWAPSTVVYAEHRL